ncbi:hypothetical protein EVAR_99996_1 [Eumeta japonica]|uniref:Uncharacterized protein n=1 Tax=Eumeta variegata TaxID=151549 RepID=A0A4C1ZE82_EUMVA|nr:hypothetical protein EVAR_99996_1 [Eumeta japonica]
MSYETLKATGIAGHHDVTRAPDSRELSRQYVLWAAVKRMEGPCNTSCECCCARRPPPAPDALCLVTIVREIYGAERSQRQPCRPARARARAV